MQKYFYPIFKLPDYYVRDYQKQELPLWVKWWLLGKAGRELSEILTGSEFTLLHTLNKKFKIFELKGQTSQVQLEGKNLVNISEVTSSSTSPVTLQEFTNYELGKTYTFSAKLDFESSSTSGRVRMRITYNDETPTSYVGNYVVGGGIKTSDATITITDNIESIELQYQPNSVGIKYFDFQLEESSTATSYEPYCGRHSCPKSTDMNVLLKM